MGWIMSYTMRMMNPPDISYHLHELTSLRDPHLLDWLDLYESAFPGYERGPVSGHIRTLLAREAGKPTRMAQTFLNEEYHLAYLGYIAIVPERRGGGGGSIFYQLLLPQVKENADFLLFDVERPDCIADPELRRQAERRICFYERLGAALLPGVTMYWGESRQRMMFHRFTGVEDQEIMNRARALVGDFHGELRED
jgi:GNAT superfamily N-acetyltransferase